MITAKIAPRQSKPAFYELKAENATGDEIQFDQFNDKNHHK